MPEHRNISRAAEMKRLLFLAFFVATTLFASGAGALAPGCQVARLPGYQTPAIWYGSPATRQLVNSATGNPATRQLGNPATGNPATRQPDAHEPLTLNAPSRDAILHGGSDALIAWSADSLPRGVEEWEAFLSIDAGRHYAVRITPHLDAGIRAFRFRVPNVATRDARILLRVGDEEHERIIAIPYSFAIEAEFGRLELGRAEGTEARGESARFDDDHVVEWRDADREVRHRDGGAVRNVVAPSGDSPDTVYPTNAFARIATPRLVARVSRVHPPRPPTRAIARDALLLSTRLNV
jgi:hypothetical protein